MDPTAALLREVREKRELPSPDAARLIRQAAKVSQARMAAALGINRATLSRWESGQIRPRGDQLSRYLRLLNELQRELAS